MKILVTGSRTWTDRKIIHQALHHLDEGDVLVHGANGKYDKLREIYVGADILCEQFALVHSIPIRRYPVTDADWKQHGRAAGPRRNRLMYEEEWPEQVVAFRMSGTSAGTDNMVEIALEDGTPVTVYYLDGEQLSQFAPTSWDEYCRRVGRKS